MIALLREHMGFKTLDLPFWSWKFNEKAGRLKTLGVVVKYDDKIIGFSSFFPFKFTGPAKEYVGWEVADVVIHTEYAERDSLQR